MGGSKPRTRDAQAARQDFLSSEDGIDYDKLARVCATAAARAPRGPQRGVALNSSVAEFGDFDADQVQETKGRLDDIVATSVERGNWTRGSGMAARHLLQKLPASDVADFESLFQSTMANTNITVQPGAWVPTRLN